LKVTYTEEAIADIVEAINYLKERNRTAAAKLDADIVTCIDRLAAQDFDGPVSRLRPGTLVRSWAVPPSRIYYQRHCAFTVISLMPSSPPTCLFNIPETTNGMTSRSRGVSDS
jgi:plasmid stabilization system protein ParE